MNIVFKRTINTWHSCKELFVLLSCRSTKRAEPDQSGPKMDLTQPNSEFFFPKTQKLLFQFPANSISCCSFVFSFLLTFQIKKKLKSLVNNGGSKAVACSREKSQISLFSSVYLLDKPNRKNYRKGFSFGLNPSESRWKLGTSQWRTFPTRSRNDPEPRGCSSRKW